jgi:NAD(P)-dependent dehydrogenase (short-subunit alcohol dehydrogenase family)
MDELRFDGRVAVVTGAGRGVGRGHALLLAARGARVVVADIGAALDGAGSSAAPADEVVDEIRGAGGEAVAVHASVADPDGAAAIVATAVDTFGGLDIVVNNAGISDPERFENLPFEHFRRMVEVHYFGTVHVIQAAWPHLVASGYGRIVNTCSEGMLGINGKVTSYAGGKGAVFGLTRALAVEAAPQGVLVNAVAPRANTRLAAPEVVAFTHDVPVEAVRGRMDAFRPELVAPAMAYLAHESCRLNGEVLVAGAGQVMRLAVVESQGITDDDLTPEAVAESFDRILDLTDPMVVEVGGFPTADGH